MSRKHSLIVVGTLVLGIIFVVVMARLKQGPAHEGVKPEVQAVRVMEVTPMAFQFQARGFGKVSPGETWQAVANVGGRITWRHPNLESGNLISEGTRLLQIDPTRYELAIAVAKADIAAATAELEQLEQETENTRKLLALENSRLSLAQRELERARTLATKNALSATRLDDQEKVTLQQQQAVQSMENTLSLMPSKKSTLEARLVRAETALDQAREDLEDTRFQAPFDLRIHSAQVELHQQVSPGQPLFTADSIATAEAVIQLPVPDLRHLLAQLGTGGNILADHLPNLDQRRIFEDVTATLSLAGDPQTRWSARVTRIASGLDPATRTVQAVLTVDEPYRNASPPEQPPLVRDMYVRGTLSHMVPKPVIVVPASAIHASDTQEETVYLATDDNRLERRPVTTSWSQRDLAVITDGLQPGERLVLDDLVPAIDGMPLQPTVDRQALQSLQRQALGEQP